MECKFCGRELEDDAVYCFYCGKRLDGKKPCPSCNAVMPEDAVFCGKCGKRLDPEILEQEPERIKEPEEEAEKQIEEAEPATEEGESAEQAEQPEQTEAPAPAHSAVWKKAVEITKICLAGLAALVGFVFTFCIGVRVSGGGLTNILFFDGFDSIERHTTLSIFDYFGKVYENLDSIIVSRNLGDTQSFALYMPYLIGTLVAVGALVCNLVFTIMTVIAVVRQYAYKNTKVNFVKPALKTFISYAIFAALFFALNASSSHTLEGVNASVYFNDVTLAALIIGGVFFGGYFACNAVLRMTDFTDKKEIINSSVALGTGIVGIVIATLLTLTACRFATAANSYSLGFMPMIGHSALEIGDDTNCGGVMCFGIPGFAVQIALLILTVCVIVSISARIGSGNGSAKKPLGVAIAAAILSVLYFLAAFATASMVNSEIVLENTISRSYGAPISVIVLSFLMLGGVIACIVLDKKFKRTV